MNATLPLAAFGRLFLCGTLALAAAGCGVARAAEAASGPVLLSRTGGGGAGWSSEKELIAAADQGNPRACAELGELLLHGGETPKDVPRALKLLEQAARAGQAQPAFRLGMLLEEGAVMPQDQPRAVAYLRAAAVGGVAEAFRNVGVVYSTGRGVKRDYAEALAWFILAEKYGTADTVAADLRTFLTKQRRPEQIAAGERRAPELERELKQTTVAQALPPAAELAAVDATAPSEEPPVKLVVPSGRVLSWANLAALQRAADQGTPDALTALGQILLEGKLLPEDWKRAISLLERAAQAGGADAAQVLAELYTKGEKGAPRDPGKAFTYTLQAARGGVRPAIYNLGALYANGTGTKADYTESLAWLLVAQHFKLDSGSAQRIRDYLASIDAKQIPRAERLAAERVKAIEAARAP